MQKQDSEKGPALGLHKKRDFFCRPYGGAENRSCGFGCIIVILLISEGGRRRTDYLRGIMLSSPHLFYSSSKIYPPVFFRRLKYTWVSPVFFCGNI